MCVGLVLILGIVLRLLVLLLAVTIDGSAIMMASVFWPGEGGVSGEGGV